MYTGGSAWFAHDDARRGTLAIGKLADLVLLSKDYLSVPVEDIGGIHSLLTMVDGRAVYAEGPLARFEERCWTGVARYRVEAVDPTVTGLAEHTYLDIITKELRNGKAHH